MNRVLRRALPGVLAMLLAMTSGAQADLVGLWRFDNNESPQPDSSGKGGNGVLVGDVRWVNDNQRGGVMTFDGDLDYLEVADSDPLSIEGPITIVAWANFASFDNWNAIVGKTGIGANANRPAPYDLYTLHLGNGRVQGYFGNGGEQISQVLSDAPPEAETWTHIAVTVTEDLALTHYLNGEINGEGDLKFPLVDQDQNLIIGSRGDLFTHMNGRLDDVAVFNEALTSAQINSVMKGDFSAWLKASIAGDYNGNGELDEPDMNLIADAVRQPNADKKYDANKDGVVNDSDRVFWVNDLKKTWMGDANLNGQFNSSDFVQVFQRGEYEDALPKNSTWSDGDWNNDQEFNSSDFVTAFQAGGYEAGPKAAVSSVPEPSTLVGLLLGMLALVQRSRRRHGD